MDRYVRYTYDFAGPFFVKLPINRALGLIDELQQKGAEVDLMPEGFIPTKEDFQCRIEPATTLPRTGSPPSVAVPRLKTVLLWLQRTVKRWIARSAWRTSGKSGSKPRSTTRRS